MSVADQLGFGPKREVTVNEDGSAIIVVTPHKMSGVSRRSSVALTKEQYQGYLKWRQGELIQRAIPNLSATNREILMTGIGAEDWDKMFKEEGD